jgi:hypothetical protein
MQYSSFFHTKQWALIMCLAFCATWHSPANAQTTTADQQKETIIMGDRDVLQDRLDKLTSLSNKGLPWIKEQFNTKVNDDTAYIIQYIKNADQTFRNQNPGDYLFFDDTSQDTQTETIYEDIITGTYAEINGTQTQKDAICNAVVELDILANNAFQKANQVVYITEQLSAGYTDKDQLLEEMTTLRRKIEQQRTIAELYLQKTRRDCLRGKPPAISNGGILPGISTEETQKAGNETAGLSYVRDKLLPSVANALLTISLALAVVAIVLIGMMFVLSELDRDLLDKAKDALFWLFIGIIIVLLSFSIVKLVLNVNLLG